MGCETVPIIRPISELRSNFAEISKVAHETAEPIFFTKNGYGDLVVMSIEVYEEMCRKLGEDTKTSASENS